MLYISKEVTDCLYHAINLQGSMRFRILCFNTKSTRHFIPCFKHKTMYRTHYTMIQIYKEVPETICNVLNLRASTQLNLPCFKSTKKYQHFMTCIQLRKLCFNTRSIRILMPCFKSSRKYPTDYDMI